MLCLAFMNPQAVRLLLDRSRYDGIVLPDSGTCVGVADTYATELARERKQIPVFIHRNMPSLLAVVRSGKLSLETGLHVLCSAVSVLAEHGFEAMDASNSDTVWRLRTNLVAVVNKRLPQEGTITPDIVGKLLSVISAKKEAPAPVSKAEAKIPAPVPVFMTAMRAHDSKNLAHAVLKYLVLGFVADKVRNLGNTPREMVEAGVRLHAAANTKLFVAYLKENKVAISRDFANQARNVLVSSRLPHILLHYLWRRVLAKRPVDLAMAETGCSQDQARLVESAGLVRGDFPEPAERTALTRVAVDPKASSISYVVNPGVYSFTQLLQMMGETVDHAFEVLRKTNSKIMFSRNPVWTNNDNHWKIEAQPLAILFNGVKHKFTTDALLKAASTAAAPVTLTSPVKVGSVSKEKLDAIAPPEPVAKPKAVKKSVPVPVPAPAAAPAEKPKRGLSARIARAKALLEASKAEEAAAAAAAAATPAKKTKTRKRG